LIAAREKVEQLEGEWEKAWKEPTRYANEMNQVEAAGVDSGSGDEHKEVDNEGTAVIGHVEVVTISPSPLPHPRLVPKIPKSPTSD